MRRGVFCPLAAFPSTFSLSLTGAVTGFKISFLPFDDTKHECHPASLSLSLLRHTHVIKKKEKKAAVRTYIEVLKNMYGFTTTSRVAWRAECNAYTQSFSP